MIAGQALSARKLVHVGHGEITVLGLNNLSPIIADVYPLAVHVNGPVAWGLSEIMAAQSMPCGDENTSRLMLDQEAGASLNWGI